MAKALSEYDYRIGIICALPLERTAVEAVFDSHHTSLPAKAGDQNIYSFGQIGPHNVIVASLGDGRYGSVSASGVANDIRRSFEHIKFGFMVGIGGGMPHGDSKESDIRLGDVVVGVAKGVASVVNYTLGKQTTTGFQIRSELAEPPELLLRAISALKSRHQRKGPTYLKHLETMLQQNPRLNDPELREDYYNRPKTGDFLYRPGFVHSNPARDCKTCSLSRENIIVRNPRVLRHLPTDLAEDAEFIIKQPNGRFEYPVVHYGTIASADSLMKYGSERDEEYLRIKSQRSADSLCFEMEAAGIVREWPCLIIRGICNYADSHKSDDWQNFAAATASAYTKDLLLNILPDEVKNAPSANNVISDGESAAWFMQSGPRNAVSEVAFNE